MTELRAAVRTALPVRATVAAMCFAAIFVCYIDRVNISIAIIPMAQDLGWSPSTQGLVLSSFYIGYLLMQIGGGRLADRFGGKVVLGLGVLLWSLFTILTPPAAFLGFSALLLARIGMGLGEAVTFPSVYNMISRWIPPAEKARAVGFVTTGIPVGTVFALIVTPLIVQALGWEWAFYLFGAVGVLWYLAWQRMVTARPEEHARVGAEELALLRGQHAPEGAETAPPLLHFLRNRALWAIIVAHFCGNWTLYVVLSWLPKYVNEGLGVSFAAVGVVSMLPHVASLLFYNIWGATADRMIAGGFSVTFVRKLMQTIAFGGLAVCLLLIDFAQGIWAAMALLIMAKILGAAAIGGYAVNHMDIGPRHAGTLMGITNTAGTLPGIIGVYVTGLILELTGSWALVFQVTAGVALVGMVVYLLFASGEKQFD
jgi:MFS family permease